VDYFPHYAGAANGKTLFILQSRFGNDGYAAWFKILELLAATEHHYIDYRKSSAWQFLLAKTGVSDDILTEILKTLADVEAIDAGLYETKIIWSGHFVENLAELYRRRKLELPPKPIVSDDTNTVNGDRNTVNDGRNPQSKVNKSIVNNKEKCIKRKHGEMQNVLLTDVELQKLQSQFGTQTQAAIEELSAYCSSRGKTYRNYYATLLNWIRRKNERTGQNKHSRALPKTYTPGPEYGD